jgi:formate dehydrogenase major subunit
MTNGWIDIKNTDMMLIMGGNPAENHPCGFKWPVEAKLHRNAKMIVVDPRFTRTARRPISSYNPRRQRHRLPRRPDQLRDSKQSDRQRLSHHLHQPRFIVKTDSTSDDGLFPIRRQDDERNLELRSGGTLTE